MIVTADHSPTISDDGLCISFASARPGGYGGAWGDLWVTTRATANEPWGEPVNLGPTVNSSADEIDSDISPDGLMLFFGSARPGGAGSKDLWQAPIIPVVDFDGDGIVDINDLVILIDNWGLNEPLCDIDLWRSLSKQTIGTPIEVVVE